MKNIKNIFILAAGFLAVMTLHTNTFCATITWISSSGGKWNNTANWSPTVIPSSADTALFSTSSGACTLDVYMSVNSIQFTNSYSGNFYFNHNKLTISGMADFRNGSGHIISAGNDTLELTGNMPKTIFPTSNHDTLPNLLLTPASISTAIGGSNDTLFVSSLRFATNGDFTMTANQGVCVRGDIILNAGNLYALPGNLDVLGNVVIQGGTLTAPASTMHVCGSWSHTTGAFVHSSGTVVFNAGAIGGGTITESAPFSNVNFNSPGNKTWTVTSAPIKLIGALIMNNGTLNLGTGMIDSAASLNCGGGTLDFNSSTLRLPTPSIDFSSIGNIIPGNGKLELVGMSSINFKPKPNLLFPEIVQNFGGTTMLNGTLSAKGITVKNGTFSFNNTHSGDNIGFLTGTGGTVDFNNDSINVSDTVNLFYVNSTMSGFGILKFVNNLPANYVPPHFWPNPILIKSGTGTTTVRQNNIKGQKLRIESGIFSLGALTAGVNDSLDTLETAGGGMDFGNCTLSVRFSNVDLSPLTTLTPGTGALKFTSSSLQSFWPSISYVNPIVKHSGTGALKLMNALTANGFEQPQGAYQFNLNGNNVTIVNNGNFFVNSYSGPNMISGLAGRTISVAGNVTVTGLPPSTTVDMSAGSTWTLNAGGQVLFDCVNFDHCDAIGSPGVATNSANNGGNINWTFVKQWISGGTHNWGDAPNWSPTGVPTATDSVVLSSSWDCILSMPNVTVKAISFPGYTGIFSFLTDTLCVTGRADFGGAANVASGTGALKLVGNGPQVFTPSYQSFLWTIVKEGTGVCSLSTALKAHNLYVKSGAIKLAGGGPADSLVDETNISGGTLDLGGKRVFTKSLMTTGGTLLATSDTLTIAGSANFTGLTPFNPTQGTIVIKAMPPFASSVTSGSTTFNNLVLWTDGADGYLDTIKMMSGILAVNNDLVFRRTKTVSTPGKSVWRFDINNTGVSITGNVFTEETPGVNPISSNPSLFMGSNNWTFEKYAILPIGNGDSKSASLVFSGAPGTVQNFFAGITNPLDSLGTVTHASNDTLKLLSPLPCQSFTQTAGTFDFNGFNLAVTNNLNISSGTYSSLKNLDSRTITVGGTASFNGQPGNLINLSPLSSWYIYLNGGSLNASYAQIGNAYAYGAMGGNGYATNSRKTAYTMGWKIPGMTLTWNGSVNTNFRTAGNWSPAYAPSDSDDVIFNSGSVNCILDTSIGVNNITFAPGYSGTFDFRNFTLTVSGNADFSNVGGIGNSGGTLKFYSSINGKKYFIPRAGILFPNIYQSGVGGGGDTVVVMANPLKAGRFYKQYGTWDWGNFGAKHSVQSLINDMSGEIDFGNCTLQVYDSLKITSTVKHNFGSAIELLKSSGDQRIEVWNMDTLPGIIHNATGNILLGNNLRCQSFSNNLGTIASNGFNISTVNDCIFAGGNSLLQDLSGRRFYCGGNMTFLGKSNDSIVVNATTVSCTLTVLGTLQANFAKIGRSIVIGTKGYAANCMNLGNDSNWLFLPRGLKLWKGDGADQNWSTVSNWIPPTLPAGNDSVVFNNTTSKNCFLDTSATVKKLTFATGYSGMFGFGSSTLALSGNADFGNCMNVDPGSGTLLFSGSEPAVLTPPPMAQLPSIVRGSGMGTLTINKNPLNAQSINVSAGVFFFGSGLSHSVGSIQGLGGSTIDFGTNTTVAVKGDVNLSGMNIVSDQSDTLQFAGYLGQVYTAPSMATNYTMVIEKNDTLTLGSPNLQVNDLVLYAGTLKLGNSHSHTVNNLIGYGGVLDFGSSTLSVRGNADFSGLQDVVAGSGILLLNSATVNQTLIPQFPDTLPFVRHPGPMALEITNNPLTCTSFLQNGGQLFINGFDITTVSDFTISNATVTTMSGLANRTLSVGGNANLSGTPGSPIILFPESPWKLSVQKATTIVDAVIGKCDASACGFWPVLASCIDSGYNQKFDFVKPQAVIIRPVSGSLRNSLPYITGTATDSVSGIATVQVSLMRSDNQFYNGNSWGALSWLNASGTTAWSYPLPSGCLADGVYTIQARAIDSASNMMAPVTASFTIKTTTPPNPAIAIVNNTGFTKDSVVTLALSVTGADSMQISLNTLVPGPWEPYAPQKTGFVISAQGEGKKKISAVYKDIAGNSTVAVSDSIVYDVSPPTNAKISIVDNNGFTGSPTPLIMVSVQGADSMQFAVGSNAFTTWEPYATNKTSLLINGGGDGQKIVFARFKDKAGNFSVIVSDTTQYDSRLPAVTSVTVLDSNGFINYKKPKIQIAAVNADSMRIALTQDTAGALWKKIAAIDSIDISQGTQGAKTIWVQVKTVAEAKSTWLSDSTVYDTTPPPAPANLLMTFVDMSTVRVSWAALPAGPFDSIMVCTALDGPILSRVAGAWGSEISAHNTVDTLAQVPVNGATMSVGVAVKNVFGSWSSITSRSMVLNDTVPPINNTHIALASVGDTAISIGVKPDSMQKDVKTIQIGVYNPTGAAVLAIKSFTFKDTTILVNNTKVVGTWKVSSACADAAGNVSAFRTDTVLVAEIKPLTPVTTIVKSQTKFAGSAAHYSLGTASIRDSLVTYTVVVKSLNDAVIVKKITQTGNQVDLFPLSDGTYEVSAFATSIIGKDSIGIKDTFTITGATTHSFPKTIDTTGVTWQMVSVPTKTITVSPSSALGSLYHWDESRQERDIYGYYHQVSEIGQLQQGCGYWRKATDTATINVPRANVLDSIVDITIYKGTYGWNQIASPFSYPVAWPAQGMLWKWNESTKDFEESSNVLEPWQGYWVMADSSMVVHLANKPAFSAGTLAKRTVAKYVDNKNWQVRMSYNGNWNCDAQNAFGFNQLASDGYDVNDAAKPPRMSDYRYVFFSHPEWKRGYSEFARDLRKTLKPVETYTIGITPGNGKCGGEINFDGLENISKDIQVFIADEKDIVQIEAGKPYSLPKADSVLYKTMFVTTDKNFLKNFPRSFNFGVPYPNPTRRFANIKYTLPYHLGKNGVLPKEQYMVNIALYDLLGRQVRQLVYSNKEPGNYLTWWDGKNNAGNFVATGMYFCRLTAGEFSSIKRLTVVR